MNLNEALQLRRSYRSLEPVAITDDMISSLAEAARLSPSCYNNQPWNFVFVREQSALEALKGNLAKGNEWALKASMIIAVAARKEDDCVIKDREYYQFDTGMAAGLMLLKATELGLVAHPIAGYDPEGAKKTLGIPEGHRCITLIIVGKHAKEIDPILKDFQVDAEKSRPVRKPLKDFVHIDAFGKGL